MIGRLVRLAVIGCFVASPFVMNRALSHEAWIPFAALMAAAQGFTSSRALPLRWRLIGGIAGAVIPGLLVIAYPGTMLAFWPGLLHAVIYTALLAMFGNTLRPGRMALVSRFATLMRGPLPPELTLYTRRVTLAWCLFFAGQIAVSILLLLFATHTQWLFFVSIATWPLVALMFLGEFAYRRYRLRHYQLETLADMARLFATYRTDPAKFRA